MLCHSVLFSFVLLSILCSVVILYFLFVKCVCVFVCERNRSLYFSIYIFGSYPLQFSFLVRSKFIHEWIFIRFSFCSSAHYSYMQACIATLLSAIFIVFYSHFLSLEILLHFRFLFPHFFFFFFTYLSVFLFRTNSDAKKRTYFLFLTRRCYFDTPNVLCSRVQFLGITLDVSDFLRFYLRTCDFN